jgi:transcription termination factor Rho
MRKARTPREKPAEETQVEATEEKPKRRKAVARADKEETTPAPRRRAARRDEEPSETREETREEEAVEQPVRPVLTAIPRPVRDDDIQDARASGEEVMAATLPPPPEPPSAPQLEVREGGLQVIKLNDLKRMRITDLAKMAHDLGIEGYQGLKKQDLIFALLSGLADKKYEVHAEGVLELLSDGFGFLRSADSDYQPSPDDLYVSRSLRLALPGAPLQPAPGRHRHRSDSSAARG